MSRIVLIDCFYTGHHPSYATTLARSLKAEGHTVIAIGALKWYSAFIEYLDETLQIEQAQFQNGSFYGEWAKLDFLRRSLSSAAHLNPDIIHLLWVDHYVIATTLALVFGKVNAAKIRGTIHWGYMLKSIPVSRKYNIKDFIERVLLRQLTKHGVRFMVHSLGLKKGLSKALARTLDISDINTAVDFVPYPLQRMQVVSREQSRDYVLTKTNFKKNSTILLLFGAWAPYKGAEIAIQALEHLPSYNLLIAGQISEKEKASLLIHAENLKVGHQLHIHDTYVPDSDIPLYFNGSDIVIIPYRYGFSGQSGPLALAAALGIPVVASRLLVLEETVQKYQLGKVFDPEDSHALASCLQTLINTKEERLTKEFVSDHADESFLQSVLQSYFHVPVNKILVEGSLTKC